MNPAVALDDLVRAMARRGATLAPEHALTVTLAALESMGDDPVVLDPSGVEVDGDGAVRLTALCPAADDDRAVQVGVMTLLEAALAAPPPMVVALATRLRSQATFPRAVLAAEVARVAPSDRAAARRALGLVVQEFYRPAREKAEAQAARRAASQPPPPAPPVADVVVQALIAEAKASAAEAEVLPGRQAAVSITGAEPTEPAAPTREPGPRRALLGALALLVVLALAALAWSLLRR